MALIPPFGADVLQQGRQAMMWKSGRHFNFFQIWCQKLKSWSLKDRRIRLTSVLLHLFDQSACRYAPRSTHAIHQIVRQTLTTSIVVGRNAHARNIDGYSLSLSYTFDIIVGVRPLGRAHRISAKRQSVAPMIAGDPQTLHQFSTTSRRDAGVVPGNEPVPGVFVSSVR